VVDASVNKKKVAKKKGDVDPNSFVRELLEEINRFRSDPASYADIVKSHIKYITRSKEGKLIYENADFKTALN